ATTLPPTATVVRVERLTFAVFPILGYSVTSAKRDLGTLRTIAELTIRPPLARVPGVASVNVQGGEVAEVHVRLDPARLESRGLTVAQVVDEIGRASLGKECRSRRWPDHEKKKSEKSALCFTDRSS